MPPMDDETLTTLRSPAEAVVRDEHRTQRPHVELLLPRLCRDAAE